MENIPTTLDECHEFFDEIFFEDFKEELKQNKNVIYDRPTFGREVRNNFNLWDVESELSKYFNSIGIAHPDDMYSIIMDSYICKLKNESYDLNKQVEFFQKYWENMKLVEGNVKAQGMTPENNSTKEEDYD